MEALPPAFVALQSLDFCAIEDLVAATLFAFRSSSYAPIGDCLCGRGMDALSLWSCAAKDRCRTVRPDIGECARSARRRMGRPDALLSNRGPKRAWRNECDLPISRISAELLCITDERRVDYI